MVAECGGIQLCQLLSLWQHTHVIMYAFLIFLLHKMLVSTSPDNQTMGIFWQHLTWSLKSLALGVRPETDANGEAYPRSTEGCRRKGNPLADGYYATV